MQNNKTEKPKPKSPKGWRQRLFGEALHPNNPNSVYFDKISKINTDNNSQSKYRHNGYIFNQK